MAINFPSSPIDGQVFNASPGVSFVANGGVWRPAPLKTALPKNYIINPSMLISQQNGDTANTPTAVVAYYPADQWQVSCSMTGGAVATSRYRPTLSGTDSVYLSTSTGVASPAAGDYMQVFQYLEGQRVADFQWGTAKAQQGVFRFTAYSDLGGTFSVEIWGNSRCFLAPFTLSATVWATISVVVPGDTAGTWPIDNTSGMRIGIGLASGTTFGGGTAGWSSAMKVQIAGNTNHCVASKNFHFTDVGFYRDPYLTGVAPPFEIRDAAAEEMACKRYWYRGFHLSGPVASATVARGANRHPVPMRIAPVMSIVGAPKLYDMGVTPTITALASANNIYAADIQITAAAGGLTPGRASSNFWQDANQYIAMDARM